MISPSVDAARKSQHPRPTDRPAGNPVISFMSRCPRAKAQDIKLMKQGSQTAQRH